MVVELNALIHQIKTDQHQREHSKIDESLPFCIVNSNDDNHGQSTTDLGGQFLHSQLLIDCLIKMKSTDKDKSELITLCKQRYTQNPAELKIVEEFEREYSSKRVVWWYTRDSFVYKILNKALRKETIHLLFLFRFVIHDLEEHLKANKCSSAVRVYRAQFMSNDEIQMFKNSLGECIAINSFFSTSTDRQTAKLFISLGGNSHDVQPVILEIDADPQLDNIKPFSNIISHSYYPEEKEVLFMIGSIFRIMNIDRDKDGLLIIRMKLCSLNDNHLKLLFQHMQKKPKGGWTNLLDFGDLLKDMGKLDDAEKYFLRYLHKLPDDHKDIASCYHRLGSVATAKGDYESSLEWHNKSLQVKMRILKADDPSIASNHLSIGNVYKEKKDYTHAMQSYENALAIYKPAQGEDHPNVAICMVNIGRVYRDQCKYPEALELFQRVLFIREKCLPVDHVDLGQAHQSIGKTYRSMQDYDLALSHYNLSLKIYRKSLPPQHSDIASILGNIGLVYENKGDFQQALSYFEKEAAIYRHPSHSGQSEAAQVEKDIRRVSSKLK